MSTNDLQNLPKGLFGRAPSVRKSPKVPRMKFLWLCSGIPAVITVGVFAGGAIEKAQEAWKRPTDFSPPQLAIEEAATQPPALEPPPFPTYSPLQMEAERIARNLVRERTSGTGKLRFSAPQLIERSKTTQIPAGSLALATLVSGASNGPVKAALSEALIVNGEVVLPEGTILLGSGSSTEERLFITFSKLVHRDGKSEPIQAVAADIKDKIAGLKGSKIGNYAMRLGAGIGLNFVSGMAEVLQDQEAVGPMGMPVKKATMKNAFLNGAEKASLEQASEIMSGLKDKQPIIEVKAGSTIYVLFGENG